MSTEINPKYYPNKGVPRNKKPLQNYIIRVKVVTLDKLFEHSEESYQPFMFKDQGYLIWSSGLEKNYNKHSLIVWHGLITPEDLKTKLGEKQWAKFCQGKREFIIQRRIDGKNIKKK